MNFSKKTQARIWFRILRKEKENSRKILKIGKKNHSQKSVKFAIA